jgi:uncharacterized protein
MRAICLLIILFFGFTAGAQTNKQPAPAQQENSLFWQVSGNGLKAPSYLFGTYHFAGKSFVDSLGYVVPKLKGCKAVVGEAIMEKGDMMKFVSMMTMKGTTLDKLFTPEEYGKIAATHKELTGTDVMLVRTFKPAAVQTMWLAYTAQKTISNVNQAMDLYFQEEGKKLRDTVIGLETLEEQMNLLFNGSMENQKKHLLTFIKKKDHYRAEYLKMYRLYQQQDLSGLSKMMFSGDEYSQVEMDELLKNRNLRWMQKLPAIISQQPTFIAVGAGHLVGEFGLINQLRLKGYTVTALNN